MERRIGGEMKKWALWTVWPDDEIKSSPILSKVDQNVATTF